MHCTMNIHVCMFCSSVGNIWSALRECKQFNEFHVQNRLNSHAEPLSLGYKNSTIFTTIFVGHQNATVLVNFSVEQEKIVWFWNNSKPTQWMWSGLTLISERFSTQFGPWKEYEKWHATEFTLVDKLSKCWWWVSFAKNFEVRCNLSQIYNNIFPSDANNFTNLNVCVLEMGPWVLYKTWRIPTQFENKDKPELIYYHYMNICMTITCESKHIFGCGTYFYFPYNSFWMRPVI